MTDQYWATVDDDKIASEITKRYNSYLKFLLQSGKIAQLRKSHKTFYGTTDITVIDQSLQAIHLNHYGNLIRHVLVDVTSQRPAWEPRAINTDLESQANTQLASGLLDFYMREKHLEQVLNETVEQCLFLHEGWVSVSWDVTAGQIYAEDPENQKPIYEGDIKVSSHSILDVARDVKRRDMHHDWYIVREFKNKWDLASKFEENAEKIVKLTYGSDDDAQYEFESVGTVTSELTESDLIPVYTLYHDKTASMPNGRMVEIVSDEIVLFDGPLPYKRKYVFSAASTKRLGSSFGHSNLMDLLPAQDAFNATVSAILTNQAANAVQNFQCPKGAAPNVVKVESGLNVWEYDPKAGKMEAMDLLRTAPEVFNFAEFLMKQKELLSGVSQISRGNAPATMSGTAMALLAQQAIQFSSGVQLSKTQLQEDVGTAIIELLQTYAVVPRMATIVGKSKRPFMKQFKGSDLKGISRVIVDTANPLTKTSAGRVEIANQLLQAPGMIKTPEQYIGVLTTGNLEPLYEHAQSQLNLMKAENEQLMEGVLPVVFLTDDHPTHVLEHSCVANSPEARENPKVMDVVMNHIQEHLNIARTMPPDLAALLKQQSIFQPPQPGVQPPQMPGEPPQGGMENTAPIDNQNPLTQQAEQTSLPKPAQPPQMTEGMQQ